MKVGITIAGIGMVNPLGVGSLAVNAAVRAGINQYNDSHVIGENGEPIKMARVPAACLPELSDEDAPLQKQKLYSLILKLGVLGLTEACEAAGVETLTPLFLALPEQRCGRPFPALEPMLKDLSKQVDFPMDLLTSRIYTTGRAGGFNALSEACELLLTTPLETAIVGGIDSFDDAVLLKMLDAEKRITGSNTMDCFVPGEGAAFIVLKKVENPNPAIHQPGLGSEPGHYYSEEVCLGEGLSVAVGEAGQNANLAEPLQTIMCSLNGESIHGKEWGVSFTRNNNAFSTDFNVEHPADCYGDLGAATVPTLLGLSFIGLEKGYYHSPLMVWAASDQQQRGAVVLNMSNRPVA